MKIYIYTILFCLTTVLFSACDTNKMFDKELYKKVIYLLSNDDLAFPIEHSLNEEETTGYVTIYFSGTKSVEEDVTITLEPDEDLLDTYNLLTYDLDTEKYAKELDKSKYDIDTYTVVMKKDSEHPYALLPIRIRPRGLSPDSSYMIPLKIKDFSHYELNEEKSRMLYHVMIKNDFAEQSIRRYLFMSGTRQIGDGIETKIAGNKLMLPLDKRKVRVCAAIEYADSPTLEQIDQKSVVLEIGEEEVTGANGTSYFPVKITPYKEKYMQVEQIGRIENDIPYDKDEANRYLTINNAKRFILSYRYRTLKTPATDTTEAEWNEWIIVSENMKHAEK